MKEQLQKLKTRPKCIIGIDRASRKPRLARRRLLPGDVGSGPMPKEIATVVALARNDDSGVVMKVFGRSCGLKRSFDLAQDGVCGSLRPLRF